MKVEKGKRTIANETIGRFGLLDLSRDWGGAKCQDSNESNQEDDLLHDECSNE
jgi:hypothetical protein